MSTASLAMVTREDHDGLFLCNIGGFLLPFKNCLTFLFFQSDPQFGTAVRLAGILAWLLIVVGFSIVSPPPSVNDRERIKSLRWVVAYLALAGLSLFWTTTNSLTIAAGYWAGITADALAIYFLLRYPPVEENVRRIMYGFIAGVVLTAIIAWAAPATTDMRLGSEDFLHPNLIGFEFALGTLIAAYLAQRKKAWAWVSVGLGVTMIRTLSKGTIVAFLFAGIYYLTRGLKISRKARIWIGIGSTLVLASFWGLMEAYLDVYTQGNNVETLTGRTYIWSQSIELSMEKLWFGHGFDSFRWIFPAFADFLPHHAHNELLQQLFAYGIVGIAIVVGVYWSFYRQIRNSQDTHLKSLAMAVLILVLVRGVVDTDQFELCFPLWLMTMFSVALSKSNLSKGISLS